MGTLFNSTKPPDDDNRTNGALNIAGVMEFANVTPAPGNLTDAPTKFPGQFVSHQYCIAGITQRHMYYIFLVCTCIILFVRVLLLRY